MNYFRPNDNSHKNRININITPPTIVTFGSCLSRRIADQYIDVYGGEIVGCTFHTRSDYFCKQLLKTRKNNKELNHLISALSQDEEYKPNGIDNDPLLLLRNQSIEQIGRHKLEPGPNLFDVVESGQVDLFIIDNYIDVVSALYRNTVEKRNLFFLPTRNVTELTSKYMDENWQLGGLLPPKFGVKYMREVIDYFYKFNPNAKIIFVNFPSTTYHDSPEKIALFKEYSGLFYHKKCLTIPDIQVLEKCKTKHKQHFSTSYYSAYAGMIKILLDSKPEKLKKSFSQFSNDHVKTKRISNTPYDKPSDQNKPTNQNPEINKPWTEIYKDEMGNIIYSQENSLLPPTKLLILKGKNNKAYLSKNCNASKLSLSITGDDAKVYFGENTRLAGRVSIKGNGRMLIIGDNTTCLDVAFIINDSRDIFIGNDCMFSANVEIRTSDDHSIFSLDSGKRINKPGDVQIEDHVWLGKDVTVSKGVTIRENCIVGAKSFVSKSLSESNSIYAGCPAIKIKENVNWTRKLMPFDD